MKLLCIICALALGFGETKANESLLSVNDISSSYAGLADLNKLQTSITLELSSSNFVKRAAQFIPSTDFSHLNLKAAITIKVDGDLGMLSANLSVNGGEKKQRDKLLKIADVYLHSRAIGHSVKYAELVVRPNIQTKHHGVDPVAAEIERRFPHVIGYMLSKEKTKDTQFAVYNLSDGDYCWQYKIAFGMDQKIQDIAEKRLYKK